MDPPRKPRHDATPRIHHCSDAPRSATLVGVARAAESVPGPAPQELIETTARRTARGARRRPRARQEGPGAGAKARGRDPAAAFRHRLLGAARARQALADRDAGTADSASSTRSTSRCSRITARRSPSSPADRLKVLPFRGDRRVQDRRSSGPRSSAATASVVPVNYTLRATPRGWKAWDVTIEGISYVRNFRNDVGAEVDQTGLDALIERLEKENRMTRRSPPADGAAASRATDGRGSRPLRAFRGCRLRTMPRASFARATPPSRGLEARRNRPRAGRAGGQRGSRAAARMVARGARRGPSTALSQHPARDRFARRHQRRRGAACATRGRLIAAAFRAARLRSAPSTPGSISGSSSVLELLERNLVRDLAVLDLVFAPLQPGIADERVAVVCRVERGRRTAAARSGGGRSKAPPSDHCSVSLRYACDAHVGLPSTKIEGASRMVDGPKNGSTR